MGDVKQLRGWKKDWRDGMLSTTRGKLFSITLEDKSGPKLVGQCMQSMHVKVKGLGIKVLTWSYKWNYPKL